MLARVETEIIRPRQPRTRCSGTAARSNDPGMSIPSPLALAASARRRRRPRRHRARRPHRHDLRAGGRPGGEGHGLLDPVHADRLADVDQGLGTGVDPHLPKRPRTRPPTGSQVRTDLGRLDGEPCRRRLHGDPGRPRSPRRGSTRLLFVVGTCPPLPARTTVQGASRRTTSTAASPHPSRPVSGCGLVGASSSSLPPYSSRDRPRGTARESRRAMSNVDVTRPPTTTIAIGCRISSPGRSPTTMNGNIASAVTTAVITTGGSRGCRAARCPGWVAPILALEGAVPPSASARCARRCRARPAGRRARRATELSAGPGGHDAPHVAAGSARNVRAANDQLPERSLNQQEDADEGRRDHTEQANLRGLSLDRVAEHLGAVLEVEVDPASAVSMSGRPTRRPDR